MKQNLSEHVLVKQKKRENRWQILKRILYIICFMSLCLIDQVMGSATGSVQFGLKNYTGVIIAVVILTSYSIKDFIKIPYAIWGIVFFTGRYFVLQWGRPNSDNIMEFDSLVWNVGIYGIVLIRMFYRFALDKKRPDRNWPAFSVWLVMILGMIFFRKDIAWPRMFLLFFGCFYLTDFDKKTRENLFSGMLDGIIAGFLLIQGMAFLYRPYDTLRYQGMYSNTNINALFYAFCYCAVLCKWYQLKQKRAYICLRLACVILTGMLWALTFFTMGRAALLTMIAVTVLFLIFRMVSAKRYKLRKVLLDGAALGVAAAVCFVPTFLMVRYIPAYVDNPVYFEADNQEEKVQKGDPVDSEKYTRLNEVLEGCFGRILWFIDFEKTAMKVYAAETAEALENHQVLTIEPGTDREQPVLTGSEGEDSAKIRLAIYRVYLQNLNLTGHPQGQPEIWITQDYVVPHAHNILLQIAYDFGWPVGLLFAGLILLILGRVLCGLGKRTPAACDYKRLMAGGFPLVLLVFGMLEINWIYGEIPFTMFFIMWYMVCCKQPRNSRNCFYDSKIVQYKINMEAAEVPYDREGC